MVVCSLEEGLILLYLLVSKCGAPTTLPCVNATSILYFNIPDPALRPQNYENKQFTLSYLTGIAIVLTRKKREFALSRHSHNSRFPCAPLVGSLFRLVCPYFLSMTLFSSITHRTLSIYFKCLLE